MFSLPEIARPIRILAVLARFAITSSISGRVDRWRGRPSSGAKRFRRLLENLGGVFVKWGQVLSLQPDLLPREYCDELFDLLDRMPPFPLSEVEQLLRQELGAGSSELFDSFEPTPAAAASVAQVHVARIGERKLAVKLLRPSTRRNFGPDLATLRGLRWLVVHFGARRHRWMADIIGEFVEWTESELDFRNEARVLERMSRSAAGDSQRTVPAVDWGLTSRRVLTTEYLPGPTVLELIRDRAAGGRLSRQLEAEGFDDRLFATRLVESFLDDVFRQGVFHADLHPANLLILSGNRVGYVDLGLHGALSRFARRELLTLALAYTRGDLDGIYDAFCALGARGHAGDGSSFRRGLDDLADEWYSFAQDGSIVLRKSYTLVFIEMTQLARRTNSWPQPEVLAYFRSVVTLDGLAKRFAPEVDVGGVLEAFCAEYLRERTIVHSLAPHRAVEGAASLVRLSALGIPRLVRFLEGLRRRESWHTASAVENPRAVRIFSLACTAGLLGIAIHFAEASGGPGFNLVTAEALLLATAIGATVFAALQDLRSDRRLETGDDDLPHRQEGQE